MLVDILAELRKWAFREGKPPAVGRPPCSRRVQQQASSSSSSASAIPPLSSVNNALLCICSLCLIYNSHNVCRAWKAQCGARIEGREHWLNLLQDAAAGSHWLLQNGLRGKCVLSIEPLPSVPPADPLSIFTQHLHTVIHDLIACTIKRSGVALLPRTVDAAPEPSCLVVASHRKLYISQRPWWKATSEAFF